MNRSTIIIRIALLFLKRNVSLNATHIYFYLRGRGLKTRERDTVLRVSRSFTSREAEGATGENERFSIRANALGDNGKATMESRRFRAIPRRPIIESDRGSFCDNEGQERERISRAFLNESIAIAISSTTNC